MELTLKITNEAELSKFAILLSSLFPATEIQVAVSEKPETSKRKKASLNTAIAPVKESTKATTETISTSEVLEVKSQVFSDHTPLAETTIKVEEIRKLAVAKIQANEAVKPLVNEMVVKLGATAISNIPEDKREEFMNFLNTL